MAVIVNSRGPGLSQAPEPANDPANRATSTFVRVTSVPPFQAHEPDACEGAKGEGDVVAQPFAWFLVCTKVMA